MNKQKKNQFFTFRTSAFETKDYHEILGVPKNASAKDVKLAYLEKCKQFHPDIVRCDDPKQIAAIEEKFQEIVEAFDYLYVRSYKHKAKVRTSNTSNFHSKTNNHNPFNESTKTEEEEVFYRKIEVLFWGGMTFGLLMLAFQIGYRQYNTTNLNRDKK